MNGKRFHLRTPSEIQRGIPPREIDEEELEKALLAEEEDEVDDEDIIISRLLVAARNGDQKAAKELKEFLGGE